MTISLNVSLAGEIDESYEIIIGQGLAVEIAGSASIASKSSNAAIISDDIVSSLHSGPIMSALKKTGLDPHLVTFPHGEKSKSLASYSRLICKVFDAGLDRNSVIIALGGGVSGDLAGFIAATYMRGIPFIQVPTSLLAMVDSSIGGKVGIDLPGGKNMCGSFRQPAKVLIDIMYLQTLPDAEMINGLSEIIKHGMVLDQDLFDYVENNIEMIMKKDPEHLMGVIASSLKVKASVIEEDPHEKNMRMSLNFGHTIGHAIEKQSRYSIPHGKAVGIGMVVESRIAVHSGILDDDDSARLRSLVEKSGVSLENLKIAPSEIIRELHRDKKSIDGKVLFALPSKIGKMHTAGGRYAVSVKDHAIERSLKEIA